MTKAEFYAKHNITNNTIIPADFDKQLLEAYLVEQQGEEKTREILENFWEYFNLPEQYDGFYPPQKRLIFYNTEYKENLYKIGLNDNDIKELNLEHTPEIERNLSEWNLTKKEYAALSEEDKKKFGGDLRLRNIVTRIGENIYIGGFYGNCGSFGCPIWLSARKNKQWKDKNIVATLNCKEIDVNKDDLYECNIFGGYNLTIPELYEYRPFLELMDRYNKIHQDYVYEYIQRRKIDKNSFYNHQL